MLRRAVRTRRIALALAAVLALLGIVLGVQRLGRDRFVRAVSLAGEALGDGAQLVLDAGWLLLLLAAAALAVSGPRGRAVGRWLTSRPVRWGAAAAGLLVVLVLVVVVLPPRFTAHRDFGVAGSAEELKAQDAVRNTLLLALAGGVGVLGAYFTYRQLRVTREGQITDRYTKAVDQLGSQHLDVRLGGIYALERIARDSPPDRATIEEVLTAFVRGHAPWPPPPPSAPTEPAVPQPPTTTTTSRQPRPAARSAADTNRAGRPPETLAEPPHPGVVGPAEARRLVGRELPLEPVDEPPPPEADVRPAADVQAVMTVLGRRPFPPDGIRQLDLSRVDLQGAYLHKANLQFASFQDANLQWAMLVEANLHGAVLYRADLQRALLHRANLQNAFLWGANLRLAQLNNTGREGDVDANLEGARADKATRWPGGLRLGQLNDFGVQYEYPD